MTELGLEFVMDNATNRQIIVKFPDQVAVEFSEDTEHASIRAAIREICARFPDDYWAEADATHTFPWAFYHALAVGTSIPSWLVAMCLWQQGVDIVIQASGQRVLCHSNHNSLTSRFSLPLAPLAKVSRPQGVYTFFTLIA